MTTRAGALVATRAAAILWSGLCLGVGGCAGNPESPVLHETATAKRVAVMVLDADQRPLVGATVHFKRGDTAEFGNRVVVGPTGVVELGDAECTCGYDVVASHKGHRSVSMRGLLSAATISLARTTQVTVRVHLTEKSVLPEPPEHLVAWLEWSSSDGSDDPRRVDPRDGRSFDATRAVEFDVDDPGTYLVGLRAVTTAGGAGIRELDGDTQVSREVRVVPAGALSIEVQCDAAFVEAHVTVDATRDRRQ